MPSKLLKCHLLLGQAWEQLRRPAACKNARASDFARKHVIILQPIDPFCGVFRVIPNPCIWRFGIEAVNGNDVDVGIRMLVERGEARSEFSAAISGIHGSVFNRTQWYEK